MAHIPRIFVREILAPGALTLTGETGKRLASVMRVQAGEPLLLFNGDGKEWDAMVAGSTRDRVTVTVGSVARQEPASPVSLEIWAGLVRAQRFDWLVEKCTEAGADVIRPLISQHSARGEGASANREERWNRIAVEASEQSGRLRVPVIAGPANFPALIERRMLPLVIAHPGGVPAAALAPLLPVQGTLMVAIGPEGGFSEPEVRDARARGALVLDLGANILRTETAALAATVLLRSVLPR